MQTESKITILILYSLYLVNYINNNNYIINYNRVYYFYFNL